MELPTTPFGARLSLKLIFLEVYNVSRNLFAVRLLNSRQDWKNIWNVSEEASLINLEGPSFELELLVAEARNCLKHQS